MPDEPSCGPPAAPAVQTDLTPAEIEAAQYRAIHELRGTFYSETTMQQLHQFADAPPRSSAPLFDVYMISAQAKAELRVLVDALDAGITDEQRAYTRRMREILTGVAP